MLGLVGDTSCFRNTGSVDQCVMPFIMCETQIIKNLTSHIVCHTAVPLSSQVWPGQVTVFLVVG